MSQTEPTRSQSGVWTLLAFAVAALHYGSYDIAQQSICTDISFFLYFARQVAAGAVPYRDFFVIKTPLSIFAGAWFYQLGEGLGTDPLLAVRAGYLLLAALIGAVLFSIYVRLSGGRVAAGWIALVVLCAFPLLGLMPAIGNIGKLIATLAAGCALLMVDRRRWMWAGVFVGIAGLDWQPAGVLAGVAVLVAGGVTAGRRGAWYRIMAGTALVAAPVVAYFWSHGALRAFVDLTVRAALAPHADAPRFAARLAQIWRLTRQDCRGAMWLVWCAMAGPAVLGRQLLRHRRQPVMPLLCGLAVYHGGIVLVSLIDFQGHGDMFVLNHSIAFFAALPLVALYDLSLRWLSTHAPVATPAARAAIAIVLLVAIRPSFLAGQLRRAELPWAGADVRLADQREVAAALARLVGDGRIVAVANQEVLFLGRMTSAVPFLYWIRVTPPYFREGNESGTETLVRLLRRAAPHAVVRHPKLYERGPPLRATLGEWFEGSYQPVTIVSGGGRYRVVVWFRKGRHLPPELQAGRLPATRSEALRLRR